MSELSESTATELARENSELRQRIAELTRRLEDVEAPLDAIRGGEIDAIVVDRQSHEPEVFTLAAANRYYLQLAQEVANVGTWDWDLATGHVVLSNGLLELLRFPEEPRTDAPNLAELLHPDDRERLRGAFQKLIASEVADFAEEFRILRTDGETRWLATRGRVIRGKSNEALRLVGINIDITERKQNEQELRRRERDFRELADSMPQIVWGARPDGTVDYFNRRWHEFTGMPAGMTGDVSFVPYLHPDDVERCLESWYASVRSGEPYQIEYRILDCSTGRYRWHLGRALAVRNERGEVVRWFGTCTDIHEQKLLRDALHEADRRKDEFLATLAHELRNPLSPLKTAADLICLQPENATLIRELGGVITRQVEQLVRLIDDLLDVSRINSGKLELRREVMNLHDAIVAAVDISRPVIEAAAHQLKIRVPDEPLVVEGDRVRLAEVLSNLLINAAKYTPRGGRIELEAEAQGRHALVTVRDNGIGIPAEMLGSVFGLFMQVDNSHTRDQGGLGIGLTLARTLVEMHGGAIEAHSAGPGLGAEFRVRLPLSSRDLPATAPAHRPAPVGRFRILVVDDNRSAAYLLRRLLEILGQEVRVEHSAASAIESAAMFRPDILISDIAMPGVSGYELARKIRTTANDSRPILVAVTGYGQESDRQSALAAGFDHHFTKPISLPILQEFLQETAQRPKRAERP